MAYLSQLMGKASQVKDTTISSSNMADVEQYVIGFNSWIHYPLVPTRPIWETAMIEASILAEASLFLAVHGFYEEACSSLRGALDGFLTRLYWDTVDRDGKLKQWMTKNGRSTNDYWEWESGGDPYPRRKAIWSTLQSVKRIAEYDRQYGLKDEIDGKLKSLDKFVHGRPASRHDAGATRASSVNIEFKKKHYEEWYDHLKSVYRLVAVLSILQYPRLLECEQLQEFAALNPNTLAHVRNVVK